MAPERDRGQHGAVGGYHLFASALLPFGVASAVGYHADDLTPQLHRGLPSPYLTFIFSLDAPIVSGATAEKALGPQASRNRVLIAGLHSAPTYVVQPARQSGLQLAVHPLAAPALLGVPAAEVPWHATEGSDVLGAVADRLREQLVDQRSWSERFELVSTFLQQRVHRSRRRGAPRPELVEAWRWLVRSRGSGSMDALSDHVSLSARQLRSVFRSEIGISPKQVSRLIRFDVVKQDIASLVAAGHTPVLTDVASRHGYCDHPHLDREFRQLAGVSPSAWLQEERRNIQAGGHRQGAEWAP